MKLVKSPVAIAITLLLSSQSAYANEETQASAEDLEVITVKGNFRENSLQKTPSSLFVMQSQDIALRNAQNFEETIALIPNMNFSGGTQRARYFQIRGIGERAQYSAPINPSVGTVIDDIDFSGNASVASMFDIDQVEVFRGPQGTRFGATALAGLVYMQSAAPSDEFEGKVQLKGGNYNSYGAGMVLSGPMSDTVKYRFSAEKYKSDGFVENTFLDRKDTNNRDELSVRGKLAIEVSNELTLDLALLHFNFDNGYDVFSLDNNRTTLSDEPGFDTQRTTAASAKLTYTGLNGVDIVGILTAADSDLAYGYDEDWSYKDIHPESYSSTDHYIRDNKTFTAEVRFSSQQGHEIFNGTTSWLVGAYSKRDQQDLKREYTYLSQDFTSEYNTNIGAIFGQLDTRINDKVTVSAGLRFESRVSDYANNDALTFDPSDDMVGGNVVLSYELDQNNMLYTSINRGYKHGSINTGGTLTPQERAFSPEYVWNYELGYKANFDAYDSYLRTAVFYMDREDIQINSYKETMRDDGSSEFVSYWSNAASGYNQGIEIEGGLSLTEDVDLYASLGLLDTEFSGTLDSAGNIIPARDQAHAPKYTYHIGMNYFPIEKVQMNLSVEGKDAFNFSASHNDRSDEYTSVNASVSYVEEQWQVKAWARNVFDKTYATRGFYFPNDPRDGWQAKGYYHFAEPLVFGVTFDYNF